MNKLSTFVLGAAAGAIAGLLLSPNTGTKNREAFAGAVEHGVANAEEVARRAAESLRDTASDVQAAPKPTTDDIRIKINEARERIVEQVTRNSGVEDVEASVSDVAGTAEDIAEDLAEDAPAPDDAAAADAADAEAAGGEQAE